MVWGIYHAILVIVYHFTTSVWERLPNPIAIALTFILVSFGWPLFFLSLEKYALFLRHLAVAPWHATVYRLSDWLYLAAIGFITFGLRERYWLYNESGSLSVTNSPIVLAFLMFGGIVVPIVEQHLHLLSDFDNGNNRSTSLAHGVRGYASNSGRAWRFG